MIISFSLNKQEIKRTDKNVVVARSANYLKARFSPESNDWALPVTVLFTDGKSEPFMVVLEDDYTCDVPHEVIAQEGCFAVSAFNGDTHTANIATVPVEDTLYEQGQTPEPPTPDVYAQLLKLVTEAREIAQGVRDDADNGVFDGATFTPSVMPIKGGNQLSWDNNKGLQNPATVDILNGSDGTDGVDGVTFTPVIRAIPDGHTLSWQNDGMRPNPDAVNILNGSDGETPIKGVDYFTPEDIEGIENGIIEKLPQIKDGTYSKTNLLSAAGVVEALGCHETADGARVSIHPITGMPINFSAEIEAQQNGDGKPSESNPREIYGWQSIDIIQSNTIQDRVLSANFGQFVFGGSYRSDGALSITMNLKTFNGSENWQKRNIPNGRKFIYYLEDSSINASLDVSKQLCNIFDTNPTIVPAWSFNGVWAAGNAVYIGGDLAARFPEVADWKQHLAMNNMQLLFELEEPVRKNIDSMEFLGIEGINYLEASTGDIHAETYSSPCDGEVPTEADHLLDNQPINVVEGIKFRVSDQFDTEPMETAVYGKTVDGVSIERLRLVAKPVTVEEPVGVNVDLDGNKLCSMPDGTSDLLVIDRDGYIVINKRTDGKKILPLRVISLGQIKMPDLGTMSFDAWIETNIPDSVVRLKYVKNINRALEQAAMTNQPKHTATGELIALDDVYPAQPLALGVEGKTVKDEAGLTCVESAEIEVAGKNIIGGEQVQQQKDLFTWARKSGTVLPAGTFTFSINEPATALYIFDYQTGKSLFTNYNLPKATFTLECPTRVYFQAYFSTSKEGKDLQGQVELGSARTSYTPRIPPITLPIDLKSNKLCSLPNGVHDELRITREGNRGHVELVKRTGFLNTKDSALWEVYSPELNDQGVYRYWYPLQDGSGRYDWNENGYAFNFEWVFGFNAIKAGQGFVTENYLVYGSSATTLSDFLSTLPKEGLQTVYERLTPQTIDLGYIDLPTLPAPNATVWTSSNLPAVTSSVEYVQDINVVLSKLMQAIVAVPAMI